jgi:hypothetical protein
MSSKPLVRRSAFTLGRLFDVAIGVSFVAIVAMFTVSVVHVSAAWPGLGTDSTQFLAELQKRTAAANIDDALQLVTDGRAQAIDVTSYFHLGNNLLSRISVSRSAGSTYARTLDIALYQRPEPSVPIRQVTSAQISATAHMLEMDMGTFELAAAPISSGHYQLSVDFPMSGTWQLALLVKTPTDQQSVILNLIVRS